MTFVNNAIFVLARSFSPLFFKFIRTKMGLLLFLHIIMLLLQHFGKTEACNASLGRVFARQSGAITAGAARETAANVLRRAASEVISTTAEEVAKKTVGETMKGVAKSFGKKVVEMGQQAVVFGVVDTIGDKVVSKTSDSKLVEKVEKIQDNQKVMKEMDHKHEERKMNHTERLQELEIQRLQLQTKQSQVTIEEIVDDDDKDRKENTSNVITSGSSKLHAESKTAQDVEDVKTVPKWVAPLAYLGGSSGALLFFFVVYRCCLITCGDSKDIKQERKR